MPVIKVKNMQGAEVEELTSERRDLWHRTKQSSHA